MPSRLAIRLLGEVERGGTSRPLSVLRPQDEQAGTPTSGGDLRPLGGDHTPRIVGDIPHHPPAGGVGIAEPFDDRPTSTPGGERGRFQARPSVTSGNQPGERLVDASPNIDSLLGHRLDSGRNGLVAGFRTAGAQLDRCSGKYPLYPAAVCKEPAVWIGTKRTQEASGTVILWSWYRTNR